MENFEKQFNANPCGAIIQGFMNNPGEGETKPITGDEKLAFPNLQAYVNVNNIMEPLFFVPVNRFDDSLKNMINPADEPFNDVVFPTMMDSFSINPDWANAHNFGSCYTDAFICYLLSNYNIIFENGLNKLFSTYMDPNIWGYIFNDTRKYDIISRYISTGYESVFEQFKEAVSQGYSVDMTRLMFDSLADIKAYIADKLSFAMYNYINDVLTSGNVDIKGLFDFFAAEHEANYGKKLSDDLVASAGFSIVLQELLNVVTDDIKRCVDMTEILFVGYFYKLSDFFNTAEKLLGCQKN